MGQQFDLFSNIEEKNNTNKPLLKSLVLSKANTSKYEKLNKKIAKLHKEKKRLETTIEDIKNINAIFNQRIGPLEKEHLDLHIEYVKRLDKFVSKKNIPNKHKEVAEMEIQKTLNYLSNYEHATEFVMEMTNNYFKPNFEEMSDAELEDAKMNFENMKEQFKDESGQELPFSFDDFLKTPIEELMSGFQEEAEQRFAEEEAEQKAEVKKERQNFDDDVFKKLYKKLAKVLHPDVKTSLIPDAQRDELIKKLSEAWENRNYIKILEINSFVFPDDADLKFNAKQIKNLESQVETELAKIKDAFNEIRYAEAKELHIYSFFYSKSPRKQDANFKTGEIEVQEKIENQKWINTTVFKSVKKTKNYLNEKASNHIMQHFLGKLEDLGIDDDFFDF